jgi:hypothetical protein
MKQVIWLVPHFGEALYSWFDLWASHSCRVFSWWGSGLPCAVGENATTLRFFVLRSQPGRKLGYGHDAVCQDVSSIPYLGGNDDHGGRGCLIGAREVVCGRRLRWPSSTWSSSSGGAEGQWAHRRSLTNATQVLVFCVVNCLEQSCETVDMYHVMEHHITPRCTSRTLADTSRNNADEK